ncbi:MAG: hypothetical protein HQL51_01880 [Magnetococcales bacterium]|nr:hypothetical protein [Magnetococcales bacterium]
MTLFAPQPALTVQDPLARLLGAGEGILTYTFDDAVKVAGHACPTVAGAFLLAIRGMERLYPATAGLLPQRGAVRVTAPGPVQAGVNGPISQILTLITGAAAENGFGGLGGLHVRRGLMRFENREPQGSVTLERVDGGGRVTLLYSAAAIPPDPAMGQAMPGAMAGDPDDAARFAALWRARVEAILADGGANTLREI